MGRCQTAFDAEVAGIVRALEIIARRQDGRPAAEYRVFTGSQAAMRRILTDASGPGQRLARRAIRVARALSSRGVSVSIFWVPGHAEVLGKEIADAVARGGDQAEEDKRCDWERKSC